MKNSVKILSLLVISFACTQAAFAKPIFKGEITPVMPAAFVPSWYAGINVGVSRTHDKAAVGSSDSVTQIGPGWNIDLGYQFVKFYNLLLAGEIGYTQYYHSTENLPGVNIANTDHFASYLALVGQYPVVNHFSVLGKLGMAYSYAKKVFTFGASASANSYSAYYGLGIVYDLTQHASLNLQWARARGNSSTGSTDLTSLGLSYCFA